GSFIAGVGISKTDNEATETFMDINADGLPDMVKGNNVYFNTGKGFGPPLEWTGLGILDAGESVGQSANAGFTATMIIPLTFVVLKVCINPSVSLSSGVSHTLTQLADINGDGMPDFLSSDREDALYVKSSNIFRTNALKAVKNPLGAEFSLDYLLTPAVYKHPGGKMALKSVTLFDGLPGDGADTTFTSFEYDDGFYSRYERQFFGFSEVRINFHDTDDNKSIYRTLTREYSNTDYYKKGLLLAETLIDSEGRKQEGSQYRYSLYDIHSGEPLPVMFAFGVPPPAFVALDEKRQYVFRGKEEAFFSTRVTYAYDTLGNIVLYTDYSSGNENDRYSVNIHYHADAGKYIFSVPSGQEVYTTEGLKRKQETDMNEYGDITQLRKYISDDKFVKYEMEFDEYGNLTRIYHPANYKGERMWYAYEYDPEVKAYITNVNDAYAYSSSAEYDYRWGVPLALTDRNNNEMHYSWDDCGRLNTISGPYELASGKPYTLAFEYHPEAEVPFARTMHYDSVYDSSIDTYSFTDGLGRPVQVKKAAVLFNDAAVEDSPGFVVSGKVIYDAFGRVIKAYQPMAEQLASPHIYNMGHDPVQAAMAEYDVLDRIVRITLPDGSVTSHYYSIGDYKGDLMYTDSLVNALNQVSVTYTRPNGLQAALARESDEGLFFTGFDYNAIGELLTVSDPLGNQTTSVYNMTGNRIAVDHPDAGLTEFVYDGAGNTIKKISANLRKQIPGGGAITYKYDHERLTEIVYPRNIQNRVNYSYGEPGSQYNRAGRVVLVQDASGGQEFFYSPLGQVTKTIRTVQLGESDMRTWIWGAHYDTWNRVHTMTYPDGEKVKYNYNRAGHLLKMEGEKLGRNYEYTSRIGYNKYEKIVYQQSGNGSVTYYEYEPKRQRLAALSLMSGNSILMDKTYNYDALNKILSTEDKAMPAGDIGGASSHIYNYDKLNRLIQASGIFTADELAGNYTMEMQYDIMGKILHKTQSHYLDDSGQNSTSYDFIYEYNSPKPAAASAIGERKFTYDDNGNQVAWEDTINHDYRQLAWDEENRLSMISDNGYVSRYVYDASDRRVIKSHGGTQGVYINGAPVGVVNHSDNNYTLYLSPYFVFQNGKFTKHYYNGDTRLSSKIGNGVFQNQYRPGIFELTAGGINYINRQQQLSKAREDYISQLGLPPGPPTMKGVYADPALSGEAYPDPGTPKHNPPPGWPRKPVFAPPGGPPGAPIQWGEAVTNDNVVAGFGYVGTGSVEELMRYFYHTDHMGSVNYITDARGKATQYVAYMPSGELLAEQHTVWDSPYKFSGLEMDTETGLYYLGDRYYDPKTGVCLSVDPLAESQASISPYAYAANNPLLGKIQQNEDYSMLFTVRQKSPVKSVHLYSVSLNSDNSPGSIANLSQLFSYPDFREIEPPVTEKSAEDDPVKIKAEDDPEKKTPVSIVQEEVKAESAPEINADIEAPETLDIQAEQLTQKASEPKEVPQPETQKKEARGADGTPVSKNGDTGIKMSAREETTTIGVGMKEEARSKKE
ncbi:MAG: hypothetical protein KFF49_07210, partial [Bacteroidales bacterium]|nr:hypothetical protein [Bacteroidales bacterium]